MPRLEVWYEQGERLTVTLETTEDESNRTAVQSDFFLTWLEAAHYVIAHSEGISDAQTEEDLRKIKSILGYKEDG